MLFNEKHWKFQIENLGMSVGCTKMAPSNRVQCHVSTNRPARSKIRSYPGVAQPEQWQRDPFDQRT